MDSAPRDGTRILLFSMDPAFDSDGFVSVGFWAEPREDEAPEGWRMPGVFVRQARCITAELWMPLPTPPTVEWSFTLKLDGAA